MPKHKISWTERIKCLWWLVSDPATLMELSRMEDLDSDRLGLLRAVSVRWTCLARCCEMDHDIVG